MTDVQMLKDYTINELKKRSQAAAKRISQVLGAAYECGVQSNGTGPREPAVAGQASGEHTSP
jgi:hypothetical protein